MTLRCGRKPEFATGVPFAQFRRGWLNTFVSTPRGFVVYGQGGRRTAADGRPRPAGGVDSERGQDLGLQGAAALNGGDAVPAGVEGDLPDPGDFL